MYPGQFLGFGDALWLCKILSLSEFKRFADKKRGQQNHERQRDVERKEPVHDAARQVEKHHKKGSGYRTGNQELGKGRTAKRDRCGRCHRERSGGTSPFPLPYADAKRRKGKGAEFLSQTIAERCADDRKFHSLLSRGKNHVLAFMNPTRIQKGNAAFAAPFTEETS